MNEIEQKYNIPPYKAVKMSKQAAKIVEQVLNNVSSFTEPYREAKIVIEMALLLLDKMNDSQEG